MQGLVVVPIFAGYDARRRIGRVWKYDVTGGRYEEREFESIGSGSLFARESLKKSFRTESTRADALLMAVEALKDAADEDRATGGIDLERGIFPTREDVHGARHRGRRRRRDRAGLPASARAPPPPRG